ncbi:MAG: hypothetical protein HUJ69_08825, partial [Lachnospiraceae bacterium]|nr:hypothetical protein [Lachnospiraceae bacterium]
TQTEQIEFVVGNDAFINYEGEAYMKAKTAGEMLGVQYYINEPDHLVAVRSITCQVGTAKEFRTYLRTEPNMDCLTYTLELDRNDVVDVIGTEENGFYFCVGQNGYMGYVLADRLEVHEETLSTKDPEIYDADLFSYRVSLAFHQVTEEGLTDDMIDDVHNTWYYLNALAPTWWSLDSEGNLVSIGSTEYVEWAHKEFYDVWPVFTNNFDDDLTYEILSSTPRRQKLVDQVEAELIRLGIDGINVDFENISEKTYPFFIQFLRELAIPVRSVNLKLLTIDSPVYSEWTSYYRWDIYHEICDYTIIMAYDEYWSGSEVAGPVSSKKFTMQAIYDMLYKEGMDKGELILGMPWYTRIWYGKDYALTDSVACSMGYAREMIYTYDMDHEFDEETGMNFYSGYDDDGNYMRIWMEDPTSIEWRLKMALDTDLAGIAAWRIGLQNWEVWDVYEQLLIGNNF